MNVNFENAISPLEIQPLRRQPQAAESYPIDALLGIKLSDAVKVCHSGIKAPLALCAQSFLAGAAVSIQGIANLELHGGAIPLSEFFLTIAESGERKSAVDKIAKNPHSAWQREEYSRFESDIKTYTDAKAIYDKECTTILAGKDLSKGGSVRSC